jgi:hypothetical protein
MPRNRNLDENVDGHRSLTISTHRHRITVGRLLRRARETKADITPDSDSIECKSNETIFLTSFFNFLGKVKLGLLSKAAGASNDNGPYEMRVAWISFKTSDEQRTK